MGEIHQVLQAPEMRIATWRACQKQYPSVTDPEAVVALAQIGKVWEQLFPAEHQRIARLLIRRVQLRSDGVEIVWNNDGFNALGSSAASHPFVHEQREVANSNEWEFA